LAFNAYIAQAFLNQPSKPFQPLKELTKTIENLDVDARLQEAARSGAAFAVAAGLALGAAAPEAAQALGGSDIWAYRPSAVAASSVNSGHEPPLHLSLFSPGSPFHLPLLSLMGKRRRCA